jgi:YihY family inner membrane protein
VSTATLVPETWKLTGDDARETLLRTGRRRLLQDAFVRLRYADGFSHARSLAFMTSLVLVQGTIVVVGLATALGDSSMGGTVVRTIHNAVPGPAGNLLTSAVHQARVTGASRRYLGLALGLVGTLVAATTAFGQLERGLNRMYGVELDRPMVKKYGQALLLALTVGVLTTISFVALALGSAVGDALHNTTITTVWNIGRWPIALVTVTAAVALLFRWCPRRHQPAWSWLAFGATVSVLLWFVVTLALSELFQLSTTFGATYGSLAGIVALQIWTFLSATVLLFGGSVAAQLEAVRSGQPVPQDPEKVAASEPDSDDDRHRPELASARS